MSPSHAQDTGIALWTVEGCLHSGKTELARFLAEETQQSFSSLAMTPKEILAERLSALLNQNPEAAERAAGELPVAIGLTPWELEAALGCTRTERRRWVAEGRLPVCATVRLHLEGGRWVDVGLVDRRAVVSLASGAVETWRAEHRQLVSERRHLGICRGVERRAQTLTLQRQVLEEVKQLQYGWLEQSGGDLLVVAALTLAHWTSWSSRRAKWHRAEAAAGMYRPNRRRPKGHWDQERRWYALKDQALQLLAHTGWLEIRWYQPLRLWIDELCAWHYEDWCEERVDLHTSFGDYVLEHEKELVRCSSCKRDPWHYALYSLELRLPFQEETFYRFHVPYAIGKAYLPEPKQLPRVVEVEASDGLFRFGRPLRDEEVATYSALFVERQFLRALSELSMRLQTAELANGSDDSKATTER
jgi:hypothetical protein